MNYSVLVAELSKNDYNELSDEEVVSFLNNKTETQVVSKFCSFRTLANVLTDEEYEVLDTVLSQLATQSKRVEDMVTMMRLPGNEYGEGGGIDFGSTSVRDMMDYLPTINGLSDEVVAVLNTIKNKVKPLAEISVSPSTKLGLSKIEVGHVKTARSIING